MAPNGEGAVAAPAVGKGRREKPKRISMEGLQRAMSDLALELTKADSKKQQADPAGGGAGKLPGITEQVVVEEARCECCGMLEECTPEYVRGEGGGGGRTSTEEALAAHMAVCGRFNRVGRANPVLMQTEAMREILRKRSRPNGPRDHAHGGLTRSSSCIPAITKDINCASK
uniref:Uncharacterized protein n=1 Tax=Oryza brachyantha TaxID=4533 RepID=J3KXD1_ORYBR